ncbi:unnamed protein product [Calypogeia fissa]
MARDVDIGFESGEVQDPAKLVEWVNDLKDLIGKEVDLVDLSSSFMDNVFFIRRSGRYITLAGTLFEDSIFVENFEVLARCIYAMQTMWEKILLHLQVPDCDSFGIAKCLWMFYQQWQSFALRWLKISSLAIPSAAVVVKEDESLPDVMMKGVKMHGWPLYLNMQATSPVDKCWINGVNWGGGL